MKKLIISDLHIGDLRTEKNLPKVAELIRKKKYDTLILNGDIVDLWLESDEEKLRNNCVIKAINNVSKEKEVIWVKGNHDDDLDKIIHILPKVTVLNSFLVTEKKKVILITHGHQVYPFGNKGLHTKLLYKFIVWFSLHFKIDLQKLGQKNYFYKKYVKNKRIKLLERQDLDFNSVICGHTHMVDCISHNGKTLFDGGSTALTKTYITIEDGVISLEKL